MNEKHLYHARSDAAARSDSEDVENCGTDYCADTDVTFRDEGPNHVDKEFWSWSRRRHERGTCHVRRHIQS